MFQIIIILVLFSCLGNIHIDVMDNAAIIKKSNDHTLRKIVKFSIILLGETFVGKSSLAIRFARGDISKFTNFNLGMYSYL